MVAGSSPRRVLAGRTVRSLRKRLCYEVSSYFVQTCFLSFFVKSIKSSVTNPLFIFNHYYFASLSRILVANNKYHVIKPPRGVCMGDGELHLGLSKNGVYFATLSDDSRLKVWILEESSGELVWKLKHDSGGGLLLASLSGPWHLHDVNSRQADDDTEGQVVEHAFDEWNSDDDSTLIVEAHTEDCNEYLQILGFHPYKDIIFLHRSLSRGLAYHLNSSKLEDLG